MYNKFSKTLSMALTALLVVGAAAQGVRVKAEESVPEDAVIETSDVYEEDDYTEESYEEETYQEESYDDYYEEPVYEEPVTEEAPDTAEEPAPVDEPVDTTPEDQGDQGEVIAEEPPEPTADEEETEEPESATEEELDLPEEENPGESENDDENDEEESDPYADVESLGYMESTIPFGKLNGHWDEDLLTVARSQLGYLESSANFERNGNGRKMGYTRYGAWYGVPYGDWCAMFASFCLYYADVPEDKMPEFANCGRWVDALMDMEIYVWPSFYSSADNGEEEDAVHDNYYKIPYYEEDDDGEDVFVGCDLYFVPRPGDLIFFDWEGDGIVDHVGILEEVLYDDDDDPEQIVVIEGNSGNRVARNTYSLFSDSIYGYGLLPVHMPEQSFQAELAGRTVWVEADEDTLPIDSDMELTEKVFPEDALVSEAVGRPVDIIAAFDLAFYEENSDVTIQPEQTVTVYIDDSVGGAALCIPEEGDVEVIAEANEDGVLSFDAGSGIVYVVVAVSREEVQALSETDAAVSEAEVSGTDVMDKIPTGLLPRAEIKQPEEKDNEYLTMKERSMQLASAQDHAVDSLRIHDANVNKKIE